MTDRLPAPRLTPVYRLEAAFGEPLDLGVTAGGRRRIVPLARGTFTGSQLSGTLLPGASADWQIVPPDGTALGDIRYTLRTDAGDLLYVRSACATGPPRSLRASAEARTSTPPDTRFARRR